MHISSGRRRRRETNKSELPKQSFRRTPKEERLTFWEGESALLDCEVDNQAGDVSWLKDKRFLFIDNRKRNKQTSERLSLPGEPERGSHSLRLERLQLDDSGLYECQVQPDPDEQVPPLRMTVELQVVQRQPASTQHTPSNGGGFPSSGNPSNSLHLAAHSLHLPAPGESGHEELHSAGPHLQQSALQLLAAAPSASAAASPTSSFIRPQAAAAYAHPLHLGGLLLAWPYLLLALAVLLLLANVYLIYSLVVGRNRRVTKRLAATAAAAAPTLTSSGSQQHQRPHQPPTPQKLLPAANESTANGMQ